MLSPQKFSKKSGLSYQQVLNMCKKKEINSVLTPGGQFKIPENELAKYVSPENGYVSKEEYLKVVRENEQLKTTILNLKNYVSNLL